VRRGMVEVGVGGRKRGGEGIIKIKIKEKRKGEGGEDVMRSRESM